MSLGDDEDSLLPASSCQGAEESGQEGACQVCRALVCIWVGGAAHRGPGKQTHTTGRNSPQDDNRCQFGISGKGSKYDHPKMCQNSYLMDWKRLKDARRMANVSIHQCAENPWICLDLDCKYDTFILKEQNAPKSKLWKMQERNWTGIRIGKSHMKEPLKMEGPAKIPLLQGWKKIISSRQVVLC